jgi:DNA (cytosine-5)-methyltransferase 1
MLTVGSTFTGVGGADLGLERAGFSVAWQCELDAWKRTVLAAHWPDVPVYDDITTLHDPPPVDLLIGGFPCQDLSVAGKRKGFSGERSVLAFEFLRLAESLRPRWILLENVPGLLSSNGGRDMARLVDEVGTIGYGWAYRILDARYFGVPQRRRRVFICARRADAEFDTRAASELALRALWEGSGGDSAKGWPEGTDAPASVGGSVESGRIYNATAQFGGWRQDMTAGTLSQRDYKSSNHLLPVAYRKARRAQTDQDDETWTDADHANTLNAFDVGDTRTTHAIVNALDRQAGGPDDNSAQGGHLIPQTFSVYPEGGNGADIAATEVDRSPALTQVKSERGVHVAEHMSVRRLTPIECERLMGWPDNWTAPDGVKASDSKRYAACGDGIVSHVAYWIGCRIKMIEEES